MYIQGWAAARTGSPDTHLRFPDARLGSSDTHLGSPDTHLRFPDARFGSSDNKGYPLVLFVVLS